MSHNIEPQKTDSAGNSSSPSSTLLLASPHQKVDSATTAAAAVAVAAVRPHGWVCGVLCAGRVLSVPFLAVDGGYLYITPLGLLLSTHLLPPAPPVAPPPPRPSLQVPTLVLTRGTQHDEKAAKAAARAVRLEVLRARHVARVRASAETKARRYVETCAARVADHNRLVAAKKTNTGVSKASSAASVSAAAAARKRSRKRARAERRRVADAAAAGVAKNAKKSAARAAGIKAANRRNRRSSAKRSSITSKSHYAAENAAAAAKAEAATAEAASTATAAAAKASLPWVASRPQFEEDFEVSALLLQIFHRSPFK